MFIAFFRQLIVVTRKESSLAVSDNVKHTHEVTECRDETFLVSNSFIWLVNLFTQMVDILEE